MLYRDGLLSKKKDYPITVKRTNEQGNDYEEFTYKDDESVLIEINKRIEVDGKKKKLEQVLTELGLTKNIGCLLDARSEQILSEFVFYKNAPYKIFKKNNIWKSAVITLTPIFEVRL